MLVLLLLGPAILACFVYDGFSAVNVAYALGLTLRILNLGCSLHTAAKSPTAVIDALCLGPTNGSNIRLEMGVHNLLMM